MARLASSSPLPTEVISHSAVDGTANYLTAAICKLTNHQPATACTATVTALASKT